MESSQEEIYTESLPSDHDSIRLSRFTIYHSAPDLPDAVAEHTTLFTKNTKNSTPQVVSQTRLQNFIHFFQCFIVQLFTLI